MSFQSVQGGVGYNDPASDQDSRRRQQMARLMLDQSNAAPAVGVTGALNKILSGALAGYNIGMDAEEQKERGAAKNDTLARALSAGQGQAAESKTYGDGTAINWNERKADPAQMAAILAGNRDTAPMGMQMQIGQMDTKAKAEADLAKALREQDERRADARYTHGLNLERDAAKGYDLGGGRRFFPDASGGDQPPQAAPDLRTASTAPNPPPVERQDTSHTPGYVAQVRGIENGTGNPAARNPNSSAMGDGQFIDATWLDVMKRNRPDLAQGKSDRDILALRADPAISAEMTDIYGMENADFLRAGGIQNVGNAEKYAAHFFGPSGAVKVLKADANAPLSSVLSPEVIKANPHLARLTAGQWRQQNDSKFGGGAQPPAATPRVQVADASGAIPASALAPGPQRTTIGGRSGTVIGGEGEGGLFGGPAATQQNRNLYINLQTKVANGETLTPQEQLAMQLIQQDAQQPRTVISETGGIQTVTPPPLPTMPGQQRTPATDTVPNPLQPVAAPAPAAPNQPTITTIQPKAAKPIPEGIQKGLTENVTALRKIEDTLEAITKAPDATGFGVGAVNQVMPNAVTNFMFPDGVNARALIADIGSMKIHDRSGAAVSVSEFPRLAPFVPSASDSPEVVKTKLENFRREYINALNDTNAEYGADKGYSANSTVAETLKTGRTPRYQAPLPGEDPNKPKSAASGLSDADILKNLGL
jgi:hypothetical protein